MSCCFFNTSSTIWKRDHNGNDGKIFWVTGTRNHQQTNKNGNGIGLGFRNNMGFGIWAQYGLGNDIFPLPHYLDWGGGWQPHQLWTLVIKRVEAMNLKLDDVSENSLFAIFFVQGAWYSMANAFWQACSSNFGSSRF